MKLKRYHESPDIAQVGAKEASSYFIPFEDIDVLRELSDQLLEDPELDVRKLSERVQFLNDDWYFQYFDNYLDIPEEFGQDPVLSEISEQTIPVPSVWQMHGFDQHQYINTKFPFPADPPFVPDNNPAGAYEYNFHIDSDKARMQALLNFEGVDSCIYLWLNGEFVGYSQVSHVTHEFDVTDYLQEGDNNLQALVLKWSDGSYLEDQDKLRMSGIFRDVYIRYRPEDYLEDFRVNQELNDDLTEAKLSVDLTWSGEDISDEIEFELYDPLTSELITSFKAGETAVIDNPTLWSAENPKLYSLHISYRDEAIRQDVGFRKIEIKGDTFYLNNQNIKMKGVNRHDSDPVTGYYITPEQLLKDLSIMKQYNINAIRTSHYPNAPWAYEYYSRFGFYVIDEADIEIHGSNMLFGQRGILEEKGVNNLAGDAYSYYANLGIFDDGILDRVLRMAKRDKNQSSIVVWSLGNEGGYGPGFKNSAIELKKYDPTRPIQYESNNYQELYYDSDLEELDFESNMYSPPSALETYATDNPRKPYILIEYIHAMGNGPGAVEDYWEVLYKHDSMAGAFAWEWADHAVYKGYSENGQEIYHYGGDFGEAAGEHDGNFCMDGLVKPNREVSTSLEEYGNVLRPIRAEIDVEAAVSGKVKFTNMLDFIDVGEAYAIHFEYLRNDELINEGTVVNYSIPARETVEIDFGLEEEFVSYLREVQEGNALAEPIYLNISYLTLVDDIFVPEYTEMGFDQIVVHEPEVIELEALFPEFTSVPTTDGLEVLESDRELLIKGDNFRYVFDLRKGVLSSLNYENNNIIDRPLEYNIWRAPTDNDMYSKHEWKAAGLHKTQNRLKSLEYELVEDNLVVKTHITMAPNTLQPVAQVWTTFTIQENGEIKIAVDVDRDRNQPWFTEFRNQYPMTKAQEEKYDERFPFLPRFGLRLFMNKTYENLEFIGLGPGPAYEDMKEANLQGKFATTVSDEYVDYIMPQEHGSHTDTSAIVLSQDFGGALAVYGDKKFSFSASHFTQEELEAKMHNYELEESDYTVLCLDYRMTGLGSNSCGPLVTKEYRLNEEKFSFEFNLVPGEILA